MSVEVRELTKFYGDHPAVTEVSLVVDEGEFMTLLGPSGCGKTTLLRSIGGLVDPTSGVILLDGEDITQQPAYSRNIGFLFQSYALFPHMSVEANVGFGLKMHGWNKADASERIQEVLDLVDMRDYTKRYPAQLSGGQQQRVALARTLATNPRVLLLDEPLAALDRKLRTQMQYELRSLIDRVGITTIFVTHDQDEAMALSDTVAVMNAGRIVQRGTPMEVYDYPTSIFTAEFLGESNLLHGRVERDSGDSSLLFLSDEIRLQVPEEQLAAPITDRGEATLLLRPEHLRIEIGGGRSDAIFQGVIRRARDMGQSMAYQVSDDADHAIDIVEPRGRSHEVYGEGQMVDVRVAEQQGVWLIPDTTDDAGTVREGETSPSDPIAVSGSGKEGPS